MDSFNQLRFSLGAQIASDNGEKQPSSEELMEKDVVFEDNKLKLRNFGQRPWGYRFGRIDSSLVDGRNFLKAMIAEYFRESEQFRKVAGFNGKPLCERHAKLVGEVIESPFGSISQCFCLEEKVASDWGGSYFKEFQGLEIALEKGQGWQKAARQFASNLANQPLDRKLEYVSAMHRNAKDKAETAGEKSVRDNWGALQKFLGNHEELLDFYSQNIKPDEVPVGIVNQFSRIWLSGFSEDRFSNLFCGMLQSGLSVSDVCKVLNHFFQDEIEPSSYLEILMELFQTEAVQLERKTSENRADYCAALASLCKESEREPLEVDGFDRAVIDLAEVRKTVLGDTFEGAIKNMLELQLIEMSPAATERLRSIQSGMALVKLVSPDMTLEGVHQLQKIGNKWHEVLLLAESIENKTQVLMEIDSLTKIIIQRPDLFDLKPSEIKLIQQVEESHRPARAGVTPRFQSPDVSWRDWLRGEKAVTFKEDVVRAVNGVVLLAERQDSGVVVEEGCEAFKVRGLLRLKRMDMVKRDYPHIFRSGAGELEAVGGFGEQEVVSLPSDDEDQFYSLMPTENGMERPEDDLPGAAGRCTPDLSEVLSPQSTPAHSRTSSPNMPEFPEYSSLDLPSLVPPPVGDDGDDGDYVKADKSNVHRASSGAEKAMGNKDRCSFVTHDQSPTELNPHYLYVSNGVSHSDEEGLSSLPPYPFSETSICSNVGAGCVPPPPLLPNAEVNSPARGGAFKGVELRNPGLTNGVFASAGSETGSGTRPIHLPTTGDQFNLILANENLGHFEQHAQAHGGAKVYTGRPGGKAESDSESDHSFSDWS